MNNIFTDVHMIYYAAQCFIQFRLGTSISLDFWDCLP